MNSYVWHLAEAGLVLLMLWKGFRSEEMSTGYEDPAGTCFLATVIDLTSIARLEAGFVHQSIHSVPGLLGSCWTRYMEYSLAFVSFALAVRSRALEIRTESSID